jgi:hypothetical protein
VWILIVQLPLISAFSRCLIVKLIEREFAFPLHLALEAGRVQGQQSGVSPLDLGQLCNHLLRLLLVFLHCQGDLGLH